MINIKGGGRGRGITVRGRAAGLHGNNRVDLHPVQRGATVVAPATVGVHGLGQTRPNARGTLRAKPLTNIPGEEYKRKYKRFTKSVVFYLN